MVLTKKQKEILEKACKRSSPKMVRLQLKNAFGSVSSADDWRDITPPGTPNPEPYPYPPTPPFASAGDDPTPPPRDDSGSSASPIYAEADLIHEGPDWGAVGSPEDPEPARQVDDIYLHIEEQRDDIYRHIDDIEEKMESNVEKYKKSAKKFNGRLDVLGQKIEMMTPSRSVSP